MTATKRLMLAVAVAAISGFGSVPANAFWGWGPFDFFGPGWGGPWGGGPWGGPWGGGPWGGGPWGGGPWYGGPYGYPYGGWGLPYAWGVPAYGAYPLYTYPYTYTTPSVTQPSTSSSK